MNERGPVRALGVGALLLASSRGAFAHEATSSHNLLVPAADDAARAPTAARLDIQNELVAPAATTGRATPLALDVLPHALLLSRDFAALQLWSAELLPTGSAALGKPDLLRLPAFLTLGSAPVGTSGSWASELAAGSPYNDPRLGCAGPCTDVMPGLSLPNAMVTSLAVLGVGVGMGFVMSSKAHGWGLPPVVRLKLAFRKAVATTTLRF